MKMGKKSKLWGSLCLVLVLALVSFMAGCVQPSQAPAPTSTPTSTSAPAPASVSFEGKTITFITSANPGGSTDIVLRFYAKHFKKYLPGNPTIVVRNIPGGAGTVGINYFYASKPDGLTAAAVGMANAIAYILRASGVKYDLLKTTSILGTSAATTFYIRSGIIDKPEDIAKAKGIIFGGSGGFSPSTLVPLAFNEILNIPFAKVVLAYEGGAESRRAFLTGEINMATESVVGYEQYVAPLVKKGEAMPLFQTGVPGKEGKTIRDPLQPAIPTLREFYEKLYGKPPSGIAWEVVEAISEFQGYRYVLQLPPGTPDGIIRAYWDAAEKMLNDPEFKEVAGRLVGEKAPWYVGEALQREFKRMMGMDPKAVEWLKDLMKTKYNVVID